MGKKEHKNYNLRSPVKEERTIHTILTDQLGIWDLRVELERARDAQVLSFSVSDCPCHDQVKLFVKKENIENTWVLNFVLILLSKYLLKSVNLKNY